MRERTTRYVLLGVLAEGPASGYEIRQWIEQAIGQFWTESFGQIYPELKRLVDEGLAEPAEDGEGARGRKAYRITAVGRDALGAWLGKPPRPDLRRSELLLKLFFGRFAGPARARAAIEEARRGAAARLAALDAVRRHVLDADRDAESLPYSLIVIDAGRKGAQAQIDWAEESLRLLDGDGASGR